MSFLVKYTKGYEELWKNIIRPPRDDYSLNDLGPKEFKLHGKAITRTDLQIKNKRGLTLECSFFEPTKRVAQELPCVIYLHGNSSSRMEALPAVEILLPTNIQLFCFDFSGCGKSEGEYISLGWFERDDVDVVIDYLRKSGRVSTIGLWGRSMGAVTALMHADRDPSIGGMVLDSPFSSLKLLAEELVKNYSKIPKWVASSAMVAIRKTIQSKAKFDINNLVPMDHVAAGFVPAYFAAGDDDKFIDPHHAKDLCEKYAGEKKFSLVEGDHNSLRPQFFLDSIAIFFYNTLLCELLPKSEEKANESSEMFGEPDDVFKQSYVKHNSNMKHRVGNDNDVYDILGEAEDEELKRAIEESLKLSGEQDPDVKIEQPDVEKGKEDDKKKDDSSEEGIDMIPFDFKFEEAKGDEN